MRRRGIDRRVEIFLPGVAEGARYKFEIKDAAGVLLPQKADPVGFGAEHPPATASIVRDLGGKDWRDGDWMDRRGAASRYDRPIAIYEVHLGLLEAGGQRRSSPELPRAGRGPGALRARHGLYPHRADADLRASIRRLLGLSAHRSLRADGPPRHPRRAPRPRRGLPRGGPRSDPRLGARPLPHRSTRPRGVRRHGALRVCRSARGVPSGLEYPDLQLRVPRGPELPDRQCPLLAEGAPRRRPEGRRRRLHALPRLLAAGRRVGAERRRRAREPGSHRLPSSA